MRDISGKEIAIYSDTTLSFLNIWGLDNVGKINADTTKQYYLKDHLGSIRATISSTNTVISAQDYDAWGYIMENRTYNVTNIKYNFTGKEKDNETNYDYFGARYYDSRVSNWTSIDPLFAKHYDYSPYSYVIRNPIFFIDPDGKQIKFSEGEFTRNLEVNAIKYTLPEEYSSFINAIKSNDGSFTLDVELLKQGSNLTPNEEYNRILTIATSQEITEFKPVISTYTIIANRTDGSGDFPIYMQDYAGYTLTTENILNEEPFLLSSKSVNNEVYYDWTLYTGDVLGTISHELFVHAYNYIIGKAFTHRNEHITAQGEYYETLTKNNFEERIKNK